MIKELVTHIKHRIQGKIPAGAKRSDQWPAVRKKHLETSPDCVVCGGTEKIEVHHIKPFHLHPQLELDPSNLVSLCESKHDGVNCHLLFGHLGNFKSFNVEVQSDASAWRKKISYRPMS